MSAADSDHSTGVSEPTPVSVPRARWHPGRLLRGRVRPVVAAAVAGVLLGVAGTAWGTGTGPFGDDRKCWGALDNGDLKDFFYDPDRVTAAETSLQYRNVGGHSGLCRLTGHNVGATVNVHQLDEHYDGLGRWGEEYLSSRLVPMGGGLLGMASDTRAWLAVPDGCFGRPDAIKAPTVVDIDGGYTVQSSEVDKKDRAALTHMVVKVTNRLLDEYGCGGTVLDPADHLPAADEGRNGDRPGAVCRIKGLAFPAQHKDGEQANGGKKDKDSGNDEDTSAGSVRVTPDGGPVRTCERGHLNSTNLRMTTVSDPRLTALFGHFLYQYDTRLKSSRGRGSLSDREGIFQAHCQTGDVTFMAHSYRSSGAQVRALFPRYVEAEAARTGCGTFRVTTDTSDETF
ncbi:hypothetical protein [Streptomyces nodosus]|uniref:hypothetical protein n=1 Tax=Streptomyces nodosus TaxID=40318 RepID=UPI0037F66C9C